MNRHHRRLRIATIGCVLGVATLLGYGLVWPRAPRAEAAETREVVVSIIVTDEEDRPVPDAKVSVRESDRRLEDAARTRTNAQGEAEQHLTPDRDFDWYSPCDGHLPLYNEVKSQVDQLTKAISAYSNAAYTLAQRRWHGTSPQFGGAGMITRRQEMQAKKGEIVKLQIELQKALGLGDQQIIASQTDKLATAHRELQNQLSIFTVFSEQLSKNEEAAYLQAKQALFNKLTCVTHYTTLGKDKEAKSGEVLQILPKLDEAIRTCKKCQGCPNFYQEIASRSETALKSETLLKDLREDLDVDGCDKCATKVRLHEKAAARVAFASWVEYAKENYAPRVYGELEPLITTIEKRYNADWHSEKEARTIVTALTQQHLALKSRLANLVVESANFLGSKEVMDGTPFAIAYAQFRVFEEAHFIVGQYRTMVLATHEAVLASAADTAHPGQTNLDNLIVDYDYPLLEETWTYGDKLSKFWQEAAKLAGQKNPACSAASRSDVTVVVEKDGYRPGTAEVYFGTGPKQKVRVTLRKAGASEVAGPGEPSFAPCNRPGWIHVTRVVKLSDKRGRAGEGTFTAEFWLQEKSPGKLSGEGKYVYHKLDPTGGGSKGDKTFNVEGTIDNDRVVVEGDGDMEVVGFGNRTTREAVVIWDFMRKFDGKMVNNVYTSGPGEPITKYNVVYVVSKTSIQRCTSEQPTPVPGVTFPGIVIERPSTSYPTQKFPVPGAKVKVTGQSSDRKRFEAQAVTDHVGSFLVKDVPPGNYSVTITATGHDTLTATQEVKSGMEPPQFKLQTTGLPANEIAPITGKVEFVVLVRDAVDKDKPVAKATVILFGKNQIGLDFTANDYGRFDTILSSGQYRYRASASGYSAKEESFTAGGETTASGAALQNFTIYLQPTGGKPPEEPGVAAAKAVEVQLEGLTREIKVSLAPGDRLRLYSAMSSANPFVVSLGEFDRGRLNLLSERTEALEERTGPGGKPLLGASTKRRVYELQAGERATGEARLVVELRRPWEQAPSVRYTLIIDIAKGNQPKQADK